MKRILIVATRVPKLSGRGDEMVSFKRVKALLPKYKVSLICYFREGNRSDLLAIESLTQLGVEVFPVKFNYLYGIFNVIIYFFGRVPLQVSFFRSRKMRMEIDNFISRNCPDVIYAILIRSMGNIKIENRCIVVDFIDSMGLNFSGRAASTRNPVLRRVFQMEAFRASHYEKFLARSVVAGLVVSKIDKSFIGEGYIVDLPLSVSVESLNARHPVYQSGVIIFSGNLGYEPNFSAIKWFLEGCWGSVILGFPNARLQIVGRGASRKLRRLISQYERVDLIGEVESMQAALFNAALSIAPMVSGSGMQYKILEAMAAGLPVVATHKGLGGILAKNRKELLVESESTAFAKSVLSILRDPVYGEKIGRSGQRFLSYNHNEHLIGKKLINFLDAITD